MFSQYNIFFRREKSAEVEMVPIESIEDTIGMKDCEKDEVEQVTHYLLFIIYIIFFIYHKLQ